MTKDRRLGRGLAALLGTPVDEVSAPQGTLPRDSGLNGPAAGSNAQLDTDGREVPKVLAVQTVPLARSTPQVAEHESLRSGDIAVDTIDPNPFQPRRHFNDEELDSLAESIKSHQQLQPILVRRVGERFQLISGERRLRATIRAGLKTIRAEVREADDRLVAELAIIENLQRKDLNAIEKALSFKRYLTEHRCTQEDLAKRLKIDRSTIANMMRLLELPEAITESIQRDEITAGHAKALLSLGSEKEQIAFTQRIRQEGWSVRETEARVAEAVAEAAQNEDGILRAIPRRRPSKPDQIASLERELKLTLGTQVDISQTSRGRGRITIHFTSIEEFDRLRKALAQTSSQGTHRRAA